MRLVTEKNSFLTIKDLKLNFLTILRTFQMELNGVSNHRNKLTQIKPLVTLAKAQIQKLYLLVFHSMQGKSYLFQTEKNAFENTPLAAHFPFSTSGNSGNKWTTIILCKSLLRQRVMIINNDVATSLRSLGIFSPCTITDTIHVTSLGNV